MKDGAVAKRYARALEQLARASGALPELLQSLSNMTYALQQEPQLARLLTSPLLGAEKKEKLIKAVSSNKTFLRLVSLLIRRHRVTMIPMIFRALEAMSDEAQGLHRALIRTAMPLSDAQKKAVESALVNRLGGQVLGRFEVAADLIGGIWMKTGDRILDATVRGKIDSFRRTLVHSAN